MNKLLFILGIVGLLLAAVLVVLILTLPPGSIQFGSEEDNMPWVPPVIFAAAGVILLVAAWHQPKAAAAGQVEPKPEVDPEKAALNKKLETIAWGCFLILLGSFALVPAGTIREGFRSIAMGLIFLGLNAARYAYKLKMSGFTTVLGILSIVGGILELAGVKGIEGAVLIIILGAYLILKPMLDKRQLFGKAEER